MGVVADDVFEGGENVLAQLFAADFEEGLLRIGEAGVAGQSVVNLQ